MTEADTTRRHQPLTRLLAVNPGQPVRRESLTVVPLIAEPQAEFPYLLLGDAIDLGCVSICEMGSGSVPSLVATNRGDLDVLILDGEQLIGAKQNRITNRTIILEAKTETVIPVSCMEQGRWHHVSSEFRSRPKPRHAPPRVRRKAREVEAAFAATPSMATAGALHAAQGAVWQEIAEVGVSMGVNSDTGAMDEIYDRHGESLDDWIASFPCHEDQVGLLAFLGRRPLGLDVVGSQVLHARLHERFLGGYVMDAMARRRPTRGKSSGARHTEINPESAHRFLSLVGSAPRANAPTVGKGSYHLISGQAIGAECSDVVESSERLVHMSAFPGQESARSDHRSSGARADSDPSQGPIAPPSRRRNWARRRGSDES